MSEPPGRLTPGRLAEIACLLEVSARKPGNVHPGLGFEDAVAVDFFLSAAAIAGPLDRARDRGIGATVLEAVEATRAVVSTNTNLGMILLLAPMAAVAEEVDLRDGITTVLQATTLDDARHVFRAIRTARPGGLGKAPEQDVTNEPTVSLLEAMRLAADRDLVARQYASGYADLFETALPALRSALGRSEPLETAIVSAYLACLAQRADTLIARKRGPDEAEECRRKATGILAAGWPGSPEGHARCEAFDRWLRAEGHSRNPGATADLMAAALFAALRDGTIQLPRPVGSWSWSGGS